MFVLEKASAVRPERRLRHQHIQGTSRKVGQFKRTFVFFCTRLQCQGSGIAGEVPVYSNRHSVTQSVCPAGTEGQTGCTSFTGEPFKSGKFTQRTKQPHRTLRSEAQTGHREAGVLTQLLGIHTQLNE